MTDMKTANVLGALVVTLADRIHSAAEERLGLAGAGPAILVAVDVTPGILIERIAVELGRSQSTVVRAVQQLVRAGLVEKRRGADRRTLGLHLTDKGARVVRAFLDDRARILADALALIPDGDHATFGPIVEKMVEGLVRTESDRFGMCRLCDEAACGPDEACPVERGADRCRARP